MSNVGSRFADIPIHLPHDGNMFVTVQQGIFFISAIPSLTPSPCVGHFVRLEGGIGQHDNEPLSILVTDWDRDMLFGD